jgi:predicted ATPase
MIKKIEIDGLLSFEKFELELRNLNVLIGPNGSGKSNLIEVFSLLQALPTDIGDPIRKGGGIQAWLTPNSSRVQRAGGSIELVADKRICGESQEVRYSVSLGSADGSYEIRHESVHGTPGVKLPGGRRDTLIQGRNQSARESILSVPPAPPRHDYWLSVTNLLRSFSIYKEWCFGAAAAPRQPQPADQPVDFLAGDADNLALIVANLPNAEQIEREFRQFFPRLKRIGVTIFGNQALLNLNEEGVSRPVPATRWSDGMIRYLCLLAILCHPNPPPLVCIDEPDLGFHPDMMANLARLIKSASERTQVIITTHSRQLVDEFTDDASAVVVCERDFDGATRMNRLDADRLEKWLEDYTLGRLWEKGEIGGNLY